MKELNDGTLVTSRSYYFLLDWNDSNNFRYIVNVIGKPKLHLLNFNEYKNMFEFAAKHELKNLKQ